MKRFLVAAAVVSALLLAAPVSASAGNANPIFGTAKVKTLDIKHMKAVVGQGSTSAYYGYLGSFYAGVAIQYGSYAQYLEYFGSSYTSTQRSYYSYASYYAYYSYLYYYNAYYYS